MMNWVQEIDKVTDNFVQEFQNLNNEELNWKPNSDTWSIAQNIDHLIVLNKTYFPILDNLKNGNNRLPFISKIGFIPSLMGKTILKSVSLDNKSKRKTFTIWEPEKSTITNKILTDFEYHQIELKKYIQNSKEFIENKALISSPANKNIVYKLETAFDIIVVHEKRHFQQSIKIMEQMNKDTSN